MTNLGQMALFGRSYGPSKFCKLALENGLCSHVPGIIGQKFLQHLFSRAFLVKTISLLEQSVTLRRACTGKLFARFQTIRIARYDYDTQAKVSAFSEYHVLRTYGIVYWYRAHSALILKFF